jgi:hypothetical protein
MLPQCNEHNNAHEGQPHVARYLVKAMFLPILGNTTCLGRWKLLYQQEESSKDPCVCAYVQIARRPEFLSHDSSLYMLSSTYIFIYGRRAKSDKQSRKHTHGRSTHIRCASKCQKARNCLQIKTPRTTSLVSGLSIDLLTQFIKGGLYVTLSSIYYCL